MVGLYSILVAALLQPREISAQEAQKEAEQIIDQDRDVDLATAVNDSIDSAQVRVSPKIYRAIQAVERFRNHSQKSALTISERRFDNFNIIVGGSQRSETPRQLDSSCCYTVVLSPRFRRGEEVALDRHAQIGRPALYTVRKDNFAVIHSRLGER